MNAKRILEKITKLQTKYTDEFDKLSAASPKDKDSIHECELKIDTIAKVLKFYESECETYTADLLLDKQQENKQEAFNKLKNKFQEDNPTSFIFTAYIDTSFKNKINKSKIVIKYLK